MQGMKTKGPMRVNHRPWSEQCARYFRKHRWEYHVVLTRDDADFQAAIAGEARKTLGAIHPSESATQKGDAQFYPRFVFNHDLAKGSSERGEAGVSIQGGKFLSSVIVS